MACQVMQGAHGRVPLQVVFSPAHEAAEGVHIGREGDGASSRHLRAVPVIDVLVDVPKGYPLARQSGEAHVDYAHVEGIVLPLVLHHDVVFLQVDVHQALGVHLSQPDA